MATIKGIEVQINGNTTGLKNALNEVDTSLKSTQSMLKQVNSQLKFDGSNAELIKQKQDLLTDAIGVTSEKLKTLKDVESQVKQQFENGDLGRDKYIEFQTELSKTEKSLQSLKKQLAEVANQGFEKLGSAMQSAGSKISSVGSALAPASAAAVAAGTAALTMSSNFDNALAKLSTIADTSEVSMDDLKSQIIELSNESGIGVAELTNNVYDAISAGQSTGDAVNFLRNATQLATAGFTDTASSLDVLTTTLNAYGMEADEVTHVSDVLINTQNLGKTTVAELSASIGKVIPTASSANVSLEQLAAAYSVTTANGIATAESTTYINSMLNELSKTGSNADKALKEVSGQSFSELMSEGASLTDVFTKLQEYADGAGLAVSDLFNSSSAKAVNTLINNAESFNSALNTMQDSAGATSGAYEQMQTPTEKMNKSINKLKNSFLEFGSKLTPIIDKVANVIDKITDKISNMDEGQQKMVLMIGGIIAALSPVLIIGGKLIAGIGGAISGITALATSLALPLAPFVAIVAAIAAVVAALVYLYNNNEDFRNNIQTLVKGMLEFLKGIIEPFVQVVKDLISGMLDAINYLVEIFTGIITGDWNKVWDGLVGVLKTIVNTMWKVITGMLNGIVNIILSFLKVIADAGLKLFSALWDAIKGVWESITTWISESFNAMIQSITGFAGAMLDAGKQLFQSVWDGMKNIWESVSSWVSDKVSWLSDKLAFWKKGKSEMDSNDDNDNVDGSHANGLDYVPKDNYIARLHKGERILTAHENRNYEKGQQANSFTVTQNVYAPTESPRDLERAARREFVKLGLGM